MSAPPGSAASTSIEAGRHKSVASPDAAPPPRMRYMQRLATHREAADVSRLIAYGLTLGWILTLVAGLLFFCVRSRLDWLWCALLLLGIAHLAAAVILPQALIWPERIWMTIARWQGHLVMTVLLATVYYLLIWPARRLSLRHTQGFFHWSEKPPNTTTSWQAIDLATDDAPAVATARYRSLPLLLAGVIGFFFRRGNYILLPIIILLIILGLVLFIVQNSVLAPPFIYPLF